MNPPRSLPIAAALLAAVLGAAPARASFHFMQIEQVIGGVQGDVGAQAIQLRMRSAGQNLVANSRIRAWDAAGLNPILIIDMTTNVANGAGGSRVLITTAAFQGYVSPVQTPDFTMTNPIPASYLAAGSLTFEDNFGSIYWRLSWGGAAYTGSGALLTTNDANGNANPPFPGPLPHTGLDAVRFTGLASALSTTNAADYALTAGASTWTNNAGASEAVVGLPGCGVYPGIDLFVTPANGSTYQDFGGMPLPAGFFAPGSDPFNGVVVLGGQPLAPLSPLGPTDTIVRRRAPASLPNPGDVGIVPIEIVALHLVSINPITVTYNGGSNPETWDVRACLSSAAPQPQGTLQIRRGPCACDEGGTFQSTLPVLPKLVFTRTLPSPATRVLDFGAAALPPIQFNVPAGHWLPQDAGFGLTVAPAGLPVDHDCDANTPSVANLPPSTNFIAGLRADHCAAGSCVANPSRGMRLTVEQAAFAAHGILPASACASDFDGDQVCDDADNCRVAFNPNQADGDDDGLGDLCDNCPAAYNPCREDVNQNGIGDACDVAGVGDPGDPAGVRLGIPAPNPVRDQLAWTVALERPARVRVEVYTLTGRRVRTLADRDLPAGVHRFDWDTREEGAAGLASGAYYLRLSADGVVRSRTFLVLR